MNTKITSELFSLHTALNDPITYKDNDKIRVGSEAAEFPTDPLAWLFKALDYMFSKARRIGRALPVADPTLI